MYVWTHEVQTHMVQRSIVILINNFLPLVRIVLKFSGPGTIFSLFIFNWRIIALQYYVGFCHTSTWITHRSTYVPFFFNLPSTSHPIPPLEVVTESWSVFPESYRKFPLAIYFIHESESVSHSVLSDAVTPMDSSPPGSSVRGILQVRILRWVAISFCRGSSPPRDQTQVSCTAGRFFLIWATRETHFTYCSAHASMSLSPLLPTSPSSTPCP